MQALALTDALTGLVTRRVFEEELPRELARARRSDTPLSVAVVDLDHMSAFNMLRGEGEGDRLVKETAARWRDELREVDVLARLDGVEFGLILPGCGLGEAVEVLDRVRGATPRGQTASAGVARWDGEEPAELLMLRAQDALAAAKSSGRNVTIPRSDLCPRGQGVRAGLQKSAPASCTLPRLKRAQPSLLASGREERGTHAAMVRPMGRIAALVAA